jgi:hypothetical protein
MTIHLSLSLSTKLMEAEIVSWTEENSFDLDIVGRVPCLLDNHWEKIYFSCQKHIQWTLESRTQSVPRGGSTFNLFDFRVKWHEPHDGVQSRAHGSTFEFLFEFQTEFFSNFVRVSSCSRIKTFDIRGSTVLVSVSASLHWLPFVKCLLHNKPKVTFMHYSNRAERNRK